MEKEIKNITVYCGSRYGINPAHAAFAGMLGEFLAKNGFHIIYGGGSIGLMGLIADTAISAKGQITGIIPHIFIEKEQAHRGITKLIEVDTMDERKEKLINMADAFIVLPGGIGTLEELSDTLSHMTIYRENQCPPIIIANIDNFYDPLKTLFQHWTDGEFISKQALQSVHFITTIKEIKEILTPV